MSDRVERARDRLALALIGAAAAALAVVATVTVYTSGATLDAWLVGLALLALGAALIGWRRRGGVRRRELGLLASLVILLGTLSALGGRQFPATGLTIVALLLGAASVLYTRHAARVRIQARNAEYDRQTLAVMARVLSHDSNSVDVGAHDGRFLAELVRLAPAGVHLAFEPLPDYFTRLAARFADLPRVRLYECALADHDGRLAFQHVVSSPGYSGLRRRRYGTRQMVREIEVEVHRLDSLVPPDLSIAFIKIDVEGAELDVLRGALATIRRTRPTIVFEHGRGAEETYGSRPADVYDVLVGECGLRLSTMSAWLDGDAAFSREGFIAHHRAGRDFYYVAAP